MPAVKWGRAWKDHVEPASVPHSSSLDDVGFLQKRLAPSAVERHTLLAPGAGVAEWGGLTGAGGCAGLVVASWAEKVNCRSSCAGWGCHTLAPMLTLRAVVAASLLPFHLSDPTHTSLIASPNLEPHREGISRNAASS